jgi:glycosyltransferase involved in cell wall biosynthesis
MTLVPVRRARARRARATPATMHYCFFSLGSWEKNGTLLRLRDLGSALIRRGVDVSYLLDGVPWNRAMDLDPRARRIFVPEPKSWKQFPGRRRLLRELSPDYLHIISPSPKAFLAAAGTRHRVVGDWDEWPARRPNPLTRKAILRFCDNWLRRRATRCVVASRYMQERFWIEYGVDAAYVPHASFMPPDAMHGVSNPFAAPTAVFMGNLDVTFDNDILFDAALLLKRLGRMPRIEVIGDGPDRAKWEAFLRDNGLTNVTITGYLEGVELWRRLRHAHVLLFPLRYSVPNVCRCPGKTFFYAQARRPVIATNVGEVPQVLKEKGIYVEPTAEAFADAIADAMDKPSLPDVDYALETWDTRAQTLLDALGEPVASPAQAASPTASTSAAAAQKGAA